MTHFADLDLGQELLKAIEDVGYTTPTPIQEQAIPYVLQGRDVLGCAQTGTGKTAGFTLPMLQILADGRARARMPRSLILEPTRELATQVAENFTLYGKYLRQLSMALLIGGENMTPQIAALKSSVDVVIATPGRFIDMFERGHLLLSDVKIFVIDEADRMLDMGFIPDIEKIAALLPQLKQTLFFSATMPPEIRKLSDRFLSNPKSITVSPPASTAAGIKQVVINLPSTNDWQKREALRTLLKRENVLNAFIFCNRKSDVNIVQKSLSRHGFDVGALHGDLDQSTRTATLDAFRAGEIKFLACSDVAARGLDIADVSHVFNFDVPFNAEDYVHRIGRTGRAGKEGTAYTLATPEDGKQVNAIEELIKLKLEREVIEGLPEADASARSGGRQGRDGSRGGKSRSAGGGHGGASSRRGGASSSRRPPHAAPQGEAPLAPLADHVTPVFVATPVVAPVEKHTVPHAHSAAPAPHKETAHAKKSGGPQGSPAHHFGDNLPAFLRRPSTMKKSGH